MNFPFRDFYFIRLILNFTDGSLGRDQRTSDDEGDVREDKPI
jgi:hypothetical protein